MRIARGWHVHRTRLACASHALRSASAVVANARALAQRYRSAAHVGDRVSLPHPSFTPSLHTPQSLDTFPALPHAVHILLSRSQVKEPEDAEVARAMLVVPPY